MKKKKRCLQGWPGWGFWISPDTTGDNQSDRCIDDTFSLAFHLQKQSNISQGRFLSCMACKQYRCFGNPNYLIRAQWECQKRTKWFKQELLWLPQPIDSVNCVPAKEFVLLSRVRSSLKWLSDNVSDLLTHVSAFPWTLQVANLAKTNRNSQLNVAQLRE